MQTKFNYSFDNNNILRLLTRSFAVQIAAVNSSIAISSTKQIQLDSMEVLPYLIFHTITVNKVEVTENTMV